MLEALQLMTIGVALTSVLGFLKKGYRGPMCYWMVYLTLGLGMIYLPTYSSAIILMVPMSLRMTMDFLFTEKKALPKDWLPYFLVLPAIFLVLEPIELSTYLLSTILLYEVFITLKHYHRHHRKKGIVLSSNSGWKVWWVFSFLGLNLLLISTFILSRWMGEFEPAVRLAVIAIGLLPLIVFFKEDPFESLFISPKYKKSSIDAAEKYRIGLAIDQVFRDRTFHNSFDASLSKLAQLVKGTTHQISQVINESKGMTFGELVAFHRIRDAKKLLTSQDKQHLSVEGIAAEVGYASKAAFNKAFKKFTGQSPSQFRQTSVLPDKEVPPYVSQIQFNRESATTLEAIKNSRIMLSNFLKIYWRNQLKNKPLSLINMLGLTLGITSTILISIYLNFETSYDTFHSGYKDIYRIVWDSENAQTRTPHPMAQALVKDFPQVSSAVSLSPVYGPGLTLQSIYISNPENNTMFRESDIFFADSTFFDVFDFKLTRGEKKSVLDGPGEIVISERLSKKYFGNEDPVGKRIEFVEYNFVSEVAGVMEDAPANSHFHPQLLISYMSRKSADPEDPWMTWEDFGHFNYIKLEEGSDPISVESNITDWITSYRDFTDDQISDMHDRSAYFRIQPLEEIHLYSDLRWELESNGNIIYVYILSAAIVFLIAISIINYVNLSTARAVERTKEVGIKKSLGAGKRVISLQFVLEAITTCLIALILSYLLAAGLFEQFSTLVGKELLIESLLSPLVIAYSVCFAALIGLLAGIYPSLFISKLKPIEILKGTAIHHTEGLGVRKVLLAIQFIVAGIMLFGGFTVFQQVEFIEQKELGFDNDQLLVLELHTEEERDRVEAIKSEINKIEGVLGSGGVSNLPGSQFNQNAVFRSNRPEVSASFSEMGVDFDALQLLGLELSSGRWFEKSNTLDTSLSNFIVNQSAVEALNLSDSIHEIPLVWDTEVNPQEGKVVGVVEDFHFKSLHRDVQPLIILAYPSASNYLLVKLEAGSNPNSVIEKLEEVHKEFDPVFEMDHYFLDELVSSQYHSDQKTLAVLKIFSGVALFLSSLGLLGLAYLTITQKTREIGIRKVLGAKVSQIMVRENLSFIKVVGISLLIGLPISFLVMDEWLNRFQYRDDNWLPPTLATVAILLCMTVGCVSVAILKTTTQNPTRAIKHE